MSPFTTRPVIIGRHGVVTSGHYLATAAGFRIIDQGGNAIDAAAAMSFCLNLLEPQSCGIGGEVPLLIYSAKEQKPFAISGIGWSPLSFTTDWCKENTIDLIPGDGYLPACVPAVVGTWALALARFGTMSFTQILQPAIDLAENGYPMYQRLRDRLYAHLNKYLELYPTTGEVYCPGGMPPEVGEIFTNPDFANTLKTMCNAETNAKHKGRITGIEAARAAFYDGSISETILQFISDNPVEDASGRVHKGLLQDLDFAGWQAEIEAPISLQHNDLDIHKCSSWTQGPTFLQQLNILKNFNLKDLGHNSADYLHIWIESAKLAFADREAYYGDPHFDQVNWNILLSDEYSQSRSNLIGTEASLDMRPGLAGHQIPSYALRPVGADNRLSLELEESIIKDLGLGHAHIGDTTHLDAMDHAGNMIAATPSGGWLGTSPVIRGLGFPLGTRGQMFYLNPQRPNSLAPHKRPRATLTPTLITKNHKPFMAFGTPGGDAQEQWTLQFFLNHIEFDMSLQEALDAPTLHSVHFPSSFYPREAYPGRVMVESRIDETVRNQLIQRGHQVIAIDGWSNGKVMAIKYDEQHNTIWGAVAPKGEVGYAIGW